MLMITTLKKLRFFQTGGHVLLCKQIINGVLTDDFLKTIDNVSTTQELKEFYNLEVKSAVIYKKSKRIESIADWCHTVLDDSVSPDNNEYWFLIPLSG